jgi:hypothetical protein
MAFQVVSLNSFVFFFKFYLLNSCGRGRTLFPQRIVFQTIFFPLNVAEGINMTLIFKMIALSKTLGLVKTKGHTKAELPTIISLWSFPSKEQ